MAEKIMKSICYTAYRSSIDLAKEKGSFPYLEKEKYINGNFIKNLPNNIKDGICKNGIRNSHLVTIAPTGTTSILANNISSGIEPVFDFSYRREIIGADGHKNIYSLNDYSYSLWRSMNNEKKPLPEQFINAKNLSPLGHLKMQSVLQKYIDNGISKTINVPENYSFGNFKSLYMKAYEYKLKGCTTYRNNPITGSVLS